MVLETKKDWLDNQNKKLVFYVHGKGGSASESEHYKPFFRDYDVYVSRFPYGLRLHGRRVNNFGIEMIFTNV